MLKQFMIYRQFFQRGTHYGRERAVFGCCAAILVVRSMASSSGEWVSQSGRCHRSIGSNAAISVFCVYPNYTPSTWESKAWKKVQK